MSVAAVLAATGGVSIVPSGTVAIVVIRPIVQSSSLSNNTVSALRVTAARNPIGMIKLRMAQRRIERFNGA